MSLSVVLTSSPFHVNRSTRLPPLASIDGMSVTGETTSTRSAGVFPTHNKKHQKSSKAKKRSSGKLPLHLSGRGTSTAHI